MDLRKKRVTGHQHPYHPGAYTQDQAQDIGSCADVTNSFQQRHTVTQQSKNRGGLAGIYAIQPPIWPSPALIFRVVFIP